MRRKTFYIVLKANGDPPIVRKRYPTKLHYDEMAVPIVVNYPDGWGSIAPSLTVDMPTNPATVSTLAAFTGHLDSTADADVTINDEDEGLDRLRVAILAADDAGSS